VEDARFATQEEKDLFNLTYALGDAARTLAELGRTARAAGETADYVAEIMIECDVDGVPRQDWERFHAILRAAI